MRAPLHKQPASAHERRTFPPPPPQDYGTLVGAANVRYAADRKSANVSVRALHRENATVKVYFNGKTSGAMWKYFTSASATGPVAVSLNASDGSSIALEPIDFAWNVPAVKPRVRRRGGQAEKRGVLADAGLKKKNGATAQRQRGRVKKRMCV